MSDINFPNAFRRIVTLEGPSALGVADRWRQTYHNKGEWGGTARGSAKDIYDALCALGPSPDPEKAAEIIGNKSWTHPSCEVLGTTDMVVVISREYSEPLKFHPDLILEGARLLADATNKKDLP